ncbi:MAG: hypothetical protein J0M08_01925 [Bacteroidetes bacterium]|nr:hypothetical protein [Bacteroidota bacterium]
MSAGSNSSIRFIALFFCTLVALVSCKSGEEKYKSQLLVLDSLSKQLTSVSENMQRIDTSVVRHNAKDIKEDLLFIQTNFHDTLNETAATLISTYSLLEYSFSNFLTQRDFFTKEVDTTQIQISSLTHDMKHDLLEESKVTAYYEKEKANAEQLIQLIPRKVDELQAAMADFENTKPQINTFIEQMTDLELKRKNEN